MPSFVVTGPDGKKYKISGDTPEGALQALKSHLATPLSENPSKEHNFAFLPLKWNKEGDLAPGIPAVIPGMIEGAKDAYAAPYRAYTGELPMTDESGRTSEDAIAAGLNMATLAGPASVGLRAGEKVIPGAADNLVPAETALPASEIKQIARDQYKLAGKADVDFDPASVKSVADEISQSLFKDGLVRKTAPGTHSLLDDLIEPPVAASADEVVTAPLSSIEAARRSFDSVRRKFSDPPDAEAARQARDRLDQLIREPPEGAVLSGDAAAARQLYREADKNWAAAKKSELLTDTEAAAELRAAAANSGQNAGNTTRQRIASLLLNPKTASRFAPDEKAALEGVVRGTAPENVSRYVANLLGGGGGLGQSLTALGTGGMAMTASGEPLALAAGAAPAIIGALLKKGSNYLTQKHLDEVEEAIRASAPASRKAASDIPAEVARERAKEMVIRSLMRSRPSQPDAEFMDKWMAGDAA